VQGSSILQRLGVVAPALHPIAGSTACIRAAVVMRSPIYVSEEQWRLDRFCLPSLLDIVAPTLAKCGPRVRAVVVIRSVRDISEVCRVDRFSALGYRCASSPSSREVRCSCTSCCIDPAPGQVSGEVQELFRSIACCRACSPHCYQLRCSCLADMTFCGVEKPTTTLGEGVNILMAILDLTKSSFTSPDREY
jgi:hypothetical protein